MPAPSVIPAALIGWCWSFTKGTGLGKALLKDALVRIAYAADIVGASSIGSRD
jgi:hypothetical protein